ncbi:hypothetical protein Tco_0155426 [Tanacetum coccineum]
MMETTEESDDELWRNQSEWEIIRWRLYESTGVHILELENGAMIHMLAEQSPPWSLPFLVAVKEGFKDDADKD